MNRVMKWRAIGFRVMMAATLYQMKEQLITLSTEMTSVKDELANMAADPKAKMEDIRTKKVRAEELKERHALLKAQHDELEAEERAKLGVSMRQLVDGKMTKKEAMGRFYQAALLGGDVRGLGQMVYEQLGAIPANSADQGSGSNLLPTNMSNDLIMEPLVTNPLRPRMTVTQITGLERPKLGFAVDDDSFVTTDGATAKEMRLDASGKVSFGRKVMPLKAKVSETVLRSTPINVEQAVNSGLQSAQANKELKVIFADPPAAGEEHMSFYAKTAGNYNITAKTGSTMLDAIINAFGDLEDFYQDSACCVMRRQDYFSMIRELSNQESLFGKKPEEVIGFPVIFCSKATVPVIGDLRFLHLNFDCAPLYDTDKDVEVRSRIFVLTHWYDIHVVLKSAFRLAVVEEEPAG